MPDSTARTPTTPADDTDAAAPEVPRATGWRLHLPNALTAARLGLAIAFFALLGRYRFPDSDGLLIAATALFVIAALTDAADGFLARRWNAITPFGRVMDPVADKLLILGAFIYLAGPPFAATYEAHYGPQTIQVTGVELWMAIVILARELLVTSIRGLLEARGIDFSASWSGKLKMIAQSIGVPVLLVIVIVDEGEARNLHLPRPPIPDGMITATTVIAWTITAITALSLIPYLIRAARLLAADASPTDPVDDSDKGKTREPPKKKTRPAGP